ncbi:imidazole glycerol phosphate synthase subunit hisH [Spirosomataceae bacterium TFI 002]|nr:imidazole glycerol phosphate synthase subunit hisH [Spirosomataceae bacterium TFI 002]
MKKVTIIKYNAGNVMSVMYALDRLNVAYELTNDRKEIENADYIIFPGVGEASTAMDSLKSTGLDTIIPNLKQPFLATCVGMQLLCNKSQEGDAQCLGVFDVDVLKFPKTEGFKIPQTGWNNLYDYKSDLLKGIKEDAYVYFNHSFYAPICDYTVATTDYILPYSSILQKDNFYACQFHSEISGDIGEQIFKNFLDIND